jgi:hypothetical protein
MNIDLTTINDYIKKFDEIVSENNKCFEKLKNITFLKEEIKLLKYDQKIKVENITEQLTEKEKEIQDKLQKIQEIQLRGELTIEEIISEITTINNLLNNNIITIFLIEIKTIEKYQIPDYNIIIDRTIQLKEDLGNPEKTEKYLLETTIYKYMIKLINNYHHICIKIQNKNLKDSIVKIYEINKIIEEKEEKNIKELLDNVEQETTPQEITHYTKIIIYKTDLEITEYFEIYCDYKILITKIKELLKNNDKVFDYNYLKIQYKDSKFREILNNINILQKNLKELNNKHFKLNKLYYMIFNYFNYINNIIDSTIKHEKLIVKKQDIIIIEELYIEKKELFLELEKARLQYEQDKIKEIEKIILDIKKELASSNSQIQIEAIDLIKNSNDLEYKITNTNKIINYFNLLEISNNTKISLKKLLDIFIQEQKQKLKDILKEIIENNIILKKIPYIFYDSNDKLSLYYLDFYNKLLININDINDKLNNKFYYDFENNFKQIAIDKNYIDEDEIDILDSLIKSISNLSDLENNLIYYKLNIDIIESKTTNTEIKNIISIIKEKQNIILDLMLNIKLIMKNIKENCLNEILKNGLDNIKKIRKNDGEYKKKLLEIEKYFIFQPEINIINQLTIIEQLKNLSTYCSIPQRLNEYSFINVTVKKMILLENKYNKENIDLLNELSSLENIEQYYFNIKNNIKNIKNIYSNIINFYNNIIPVEIKTFHFDHKLIKNIQQIIKYLDNNDNDKNFINIIKIYNIILRQVEIEYYKDRNEFNYLSTNIKSLNKFTEICNDLIKYFPTSTLIFKNIKLEIEKIKSEEVKHFSINNEETTYIKKELYYKVIDTIKNISEILLYEEENIQNLDKIIQYLNEIKEKLNCQQYIIYTEPISNSIICQLELKINNIIEYINTEKKKFR